MGFFISHCAGLLFVQARLSQVDFRLRVKDEENIVLKKSQLFVHLHGFFYFREIMNLNQPLSTQLYFALFVQAWATIIFPLTLLFAQECKDV